MPRKFVVELFLSPKLVLLGVMADVFASFSAWVAPIGLKLGDLKICILELCFAAFSALGESLGLTTGSTCIF